MPEPSLRRRFADQGAIFGLARRQVRARTRATSAVEDLADSSNICVELTSQIRKSVEAPLTPKPTNEGDLQRLAVEVGVRVEEVSFQNERPAAVDGRPPANVHCSLCPQPVYRDVRRIDPIGRDDQSSRRQYVCRREPDRPSKGRAVHDFPAQRVSATEQMSRQVDVAATEALSDPMGVHVIVRDTRPLNFHDGHPLAVEFMTDHRERPPVAALRRTAGHYDRGLHPLAKSGDRISRCAETTLERCISARCLEGDCVGRSAFDGPYQAIRQCRQCVRTPLVMQHCRKQLFPALHGDSPRDVHQSRMADVQTVQFTDHHGARWH
jgi:hypothetical protein